MLKILPPCAVFLMLSWLGTTAHASKALAQKNAGQSDAEARLAAWVPGGVR